MSYLVTAATGNIGSATLNALLNAGERVRAVSRSEREWPEGVEGVVADLDDPDGLRSAASGVRGAFLMAGYQSEAGLLEAVPREAHVVLLSSSAAPSGVTENAVARYHIESERAIEASGHPWTMLRPNSFMANALRWRDQIAVGDVVRAPFGDIPVAVIDPADIGAVAAIALTRSGHAGQRYRLSGPEALLPGEQVEQLGEALGRPLRFEALPDDQGRAEMREQMPAAYVDAFFEIFRGGLADETTVRPAVQSILGRPPGTFAAWAAANAAAFSGGAPG
jgi:uncharacterized protein YbjT (DUF2867 family)